MPHSQVDEPLEVTLLREFSQQGTTSFHETRVREIIKTWVQEGPSGTGESVELSELKGNLVFTYTGRPSNDLPAVAFAAHMDHPGFLVLEPSRYAEFGVETPQSGDPRKEYVLAKVMGGMSKDIVGARLDFYDKGKGYFTDCGTIREVVLGKNERPDLVWIEKRLTTRLSTDRNGVIANFNFSPFPKSPNPFEIVDGVIKAPILDDLAGCAAIMAAFSKIVEAHLEVNVYAVFHWGEELGFLGAHQVAMSGILPKDTFVYSVDTSSHVKPGKDPGSVVSTGIELGKGAVIRSGDRISPNYSWQALQLLRSAGENLDGLRQMHGRSEATQDAYANAGSCEATAYLIHGYRAAAIALPLRYWHNNVVGEPTEADPRGACREEIAVSDLQDARSLMYQTAVAIPGSNRLRELEPAWRRETYNLSPLQQELKTEGPRDVLRLSAQF